MIAALYVATDGCYFGLPDVDPWDESRDARRYVGPHPVVAHPPCQRWGNLGLVNWARWGGEHNRPGNDGGCFAAALNAVNRFGGVLEHPANSRAFAAYGLPEPALVGWQSTLFGGWVCEVWQSAYGHRANKVTWLYYNGDNAPAPLNWSRPQGTHQVGFQDRRGKHRNKPTLSKREASATPASFRDALISLAANSMRPAMKKTSDPDDWRRYRIRQDQAYYGNKYTISGRPKKAFRPQPSMPTFKCLEDAEGEKST